jgi:hypothetical protein
MAIALLTTSTLGCKGKHARRVLGLVDSPSASEPVPYVPKAPPKVAAFFRGDGADAAQMPLHLANRLNDADYATMVKFRQEQAAALKAGDTAVANARRAERMAWLRDRFGKQMQLPPASQPRSPASQPTTRNDRWDWLLGGDDPASFAGVLVLTAPIAAVRGAGAMVEVTGSNAEITLTRASGKPQALFAELDAKQHVKSLRVPISTDSTAEQAAVMAALSTRYGAPTATERVKKHANSDYFTLDVHSFGNDQRIFVGTTSMNHVELFVRTSTDTPLRGLSEALERQK